MKIRNFADQQVTSKSLGFHQAQIKLPGDLFRVVPMAVWWENSYRNTCTGSVQISVLKEKIVSLDLAKDLKFKANQKYLVDQNFMMSFASFG